MNNDDLYEKPPGILTMIKTFGKEAVKYLAQGAPNVSPKEYSDRLLTCNGCPDLKKRKMTCGKCGCKVEHKAKWKTSDCPVKKWDAQG
tara:strand:+ start:23095 stop:23358 length:264 start_codon:yes stop_codon:yes gene_type:complete